MLLLSLSHIPLLVLWSRDFWVPVLQHAQRSQAPPITVNNHELKQFMWQETNLEKLLLVLVSQDIFPFKGKGKWQPIRYRNPRCAQFSLSAGESTDHRFFFSIKQKCYILSFTFRTFKNLVSSLLKKVLSEGNKNSTIRQENKTAFITSNNCYFSQLECNNSPLPQLCFPVHDLRQQSRPPPALHPLAVQSSFQRPPGHL